ncbi:MAG: hypothetical protein Hals2KO_02330 [Halioglobus sp.]
METKVQRRLVTTTELAALLRLHPFTVPKIFGDARVGRRYSGVVFDLQMVADTISAASDTEVDVAGLSDLITRNEAMALLDSMGVGRCRRTWAYWQEQGIGPRLIRVGRRVHHLRPEVIDWGVELAAVRRGYVPA